MALAMFLMEVSVPEQVTYLRAFIMKLHIDPEVSYFDLFKKKI